MNNRQLIDALWGDSVVDYQQNLHYCAKVIRAALKTNSIENGYLETIPRVGYRFNGTVIAPGSRSWPWRAFAVAILLTAIAAVLFIATNSRQPANPLDERAFVNADHLLQSYEPENWERALPLTTELVSKYPDHPVILATHACALRYNRAPTEEIRTTIEKALALGPELAEPWSESGQWKLLSLLEPEAALSDLERAHALDPDDNFTQYGLAMTHVVLGRPDRAVEVMEKAVSADPIAAQTRGDLGYFYLLADQLAEAEYECGQTLILKPGDPGALRCLLEVSLRRYDKQAAKQYALDLAEVQGATPEDLNAIRQNWLTQSERAFFNWQVGHLEGLDTANPLSLVIGYSRLGLDEKAVELLRSLRDNQQFVSLLAASMPELRYLHEQLDADTG